MEVTEYQGLSSQCVKQGKKPIGVQVYSAEATQVLAVETGHADAVAVTSPAVESIAAASDGKLVPVSGLVPGGTLDIGLVFNKSENALAKAFAAALKYMLNDGQLAAINSKFGGMAASLSVRFIPSD